VDDSAVSSLPSNVDRWSAQEVYSTEIRFAGAHLCTSCDDQRNLLRWRVIIVVIIVIIVKKN